MDKTRSAQLQSTRSVRPSDVRLRRYQAAAPEHRWALPAESAGFASSMLPELHGIPALELLRAWQWHAQRWRAAVAISEAAREPHRERFPAGRRRVLKPPRLRD